MTFFFVNYWPKKSAYWWKTSWRCDFQWFWWVFKSFSGSIRQWTMLFLREIFAKSLFIWCSRNFAHVDCWNSNAGQFFKMFFGFFWKIFKAHSSSSCLRSFDHGNAQNSTDRRLDIFKNVFRFFRHEDFCDDLEASLDGKSLSNVSICKRKNKLNYCPKILCWVHSHLAEALLLHFLSVTILTSFQQRIRVCGFF